MLMNPEKLEKLIKHGRDTAEARLAAGQARLGNGELDQAIAHLDKAVSHKPDYAAAWQDLGQARLQAGDHDGAREAWETGMEVARTTGDKQAEKVMSVRLRRLRATT